MTDASATSLAISSGGLDGKAIVAVNGVDPVLVDGKPQISPGDTVTFRLRYSLPTSSLSEFRLTDYLPLPVLEADTLMQSATTGVPPPAGEWTYGANDSLHLLPGAPTPAVTAVKSNAGGPQANSETFDYGNYSLQNQPGNPPPQASVVELLFTVRVADVPFGDKLLLTNLVTATESNSEGEPVVTGAIAQFDLTQPDLTITKGVVDVAGNNLVNYVGSVGPPGVSFAGGTSSTGVAAFTGQVTDDGLAVGAINADLTGIDAGDKVTFAITVNNNGTGHLGAFDVTIRDQLPAGFGISGDATGLNLKVTNGAGVALAYTNVGGGSGLFDQGIVLTDSVSGAIAPDLDGTAATGTTTGDIVVITYDLIALPTIQPRQTWTNTATLTGYAAVAGGINFIPAGLTDPATVTTRDPAVTKTVFATSQDFTTGSTLAIGEVVTFQITYALTEGQSNAVRLSDILPADIGGVLAPLSATIVSIGAGISGAGVPPVGTAGNLAGSTYSFDLGDVTVSADNDASNDTITVEVTAVAANDARNVAGSTPVNIGRIDYVTTAQDGTTVANFADAAAGVAIVVPDLDLTKSLTPGVADAGDLITYSLVLTNPATANTTTAFDVRASDTDLASLGFFNVAIGTVTSVGATNALATANAAGVIDITADSLAAGGDITVRFTANVGNSVAAGVVLTNSARITEYSTLPGADPNERVVTNELPAFASLQIAGVDLSKTLITTSIGDDADPKVQIGETATFDIVATLPEGTVPLSIADLLPSGESTLQFVSATLVSLGGDATPGATSGGSLTGSAIGVGSAGAITGSTATFSFGTITNIPDGVVTAGDRIVIRVVALVPDLPENTAADTFVPNTATANFGTGTATAVSALDIVEPLVTIAKTTPVTTDPAGATVTYTLVLVNAGDGVAYDLALSDPLAADLALVPGTVVYSGAASGTADDLSGVVIPALRPGETVTVTYQAHIADAAVLGTTLVNTASVNYDSLPGTTNLGRQPAVPPQSSATVLVTGPVTIDKLIVDTSVGNDTDPHVVVGETVTYHLVVTLPDGTTTLNLRDALPACLSYVPGSARLVSLFGSAGAPVTITGGSITTFDFGTVANPVDSSGNLDNTAVVELTTLVDDVPANQRGTLIINNASATTGLGTVTDPAPPVIEIVAPSLAIAKTALVNGGISGDAGDLVTYIVQVSHAAVSNAAARDITIADLLPANLALVGVPVLGGSGGAGATVDPTAPPNTIRILDPSLALGDTLTVTYTARILDTALLPSSIANTANIGYDSLPGPGGRPDGGAASATINVTGPQSFTKVLVATSDPLTGSEQYDPTVPTWSSARPRRSS